MNGAEFHVADVLGALFVHDGQDQLIRGLSGLLEIFFQVLLDLGENTAF